MTLSSMLRYAGTELTSCIRLVPRFRNLHSSQFVYVAADPLLQFELLLRIKAPADDGEWDL